MVLIFHPGVICIINEYVSIRIPPQRLLAAHLNNAFVSLILLCCALTETAMLLTPRLAFVVCRRARSAVDCFAWVASVVAVHFRLVPTKMLRLKIKTIVLVVVLAIARQPLDVTALAVSQNATRNPASTRLRSVYWKLANVMMRQE